MKMVKSLLLGSAAGLVAASAGQAADLPVKAKPVEYVKICSLYGAGFYYMPGTDICLKIGGYVRAEMTAYGNGNFTQGPIQGDVNNRLTSNLVMRARAYITADAREQTAFGTARAYVAVGVATTDIGNAILPSILGFNRAFIQWAGITAGITQSFYDFYSSAAVSYRAYNPSSDTGDSGWWVWGYTAQLGNGISATLAAEQRRTTQMCDFAGLTLVSGLSGAGGCLTGGDVLPAQGSGGTAGNSAPLGYGGFVAPDVVGNIRIDQTWGSAQVMAAAHDDNSAYYTSTPGLGGPSDKWGFAVGAGLRLNFPMIAQGDYFQTQVNYTQGALRYLAFASAAPTLVNSLGDGLAYGLETDCVYGFTAGAVAGHLTNTTGCNLTTGWGVNASYEHYWTPQFHESFVFGYMKTEYNAQANSILCVAEGQPGATGSGSTAVSSGCNNNWDVWSGATRFQYDISKSLYLGVEFLYQHYDSMTTPNGLANGLSAASFGFNGSGGVTGSNGITATTPIKDENNLAITARIHKDFLP
jgi:Porin subfamily